MNPNVGGADHIAPQLEHRVLAWFKEMLGYPAEGSGILVSGGSMANMIGLAVARNARAEIDLPERGLQAAPRRMTFYASTETHNSVKKSASVLGLGREALREIPVDAEFRIDVLALERAIAADRAAGCHPFCVVGNAGTVNTGAIDPLERLADLCAREGLWFHVDGAFGALAGISERLSPRVRGIERGDSLAFDLHKWMYRPYEVGCVLVRDAEQHRAAFTSPADYLVHGERGTAGGEFWPSVYGMQLSRGFRALKVWMSLKEHGTDRFARIIRRNVEQAATWPRACGRRRTSSCWRPCP
jgi:glutamate/tyrosine decarboxylase-like PLP-dependent enzyme